MAAMGRLRDIKKRYQDKVDFVLVYISEAHGAKKKHWINTEARAKFSIEDHNKFEERKEAAEFLQEEAGEDWLLLIDDMDDQARYDFASHPDRIYVLRKGLVDFIGKPGQMGFDPAALEAHLAMVCK